MLHLCAKPILKLQLNLQLFARRNQEKLQSVEMKAEMGWTLLSWMWIPTWANLELRLILSPLVNGSEHIIDSGVPQKGPITRSTCRRMHLYIDSWPAACSEKQKQTSLELYPGMTQEQTLLWKNHVASFIMWHGNRKYMSLNTWNIYLRSFVEQEQEKETINNSTRTRHDVSLAFMICQDIRRGIFTKLQHGFVRIFWRSACYTYKEHCEICGLLCWILKDFGWVAQKNKEATSCANSHHLKCHPMKRTHFWTGPIYF